MVQPCRGILPGSNLNLQPPTHTAMVTPMQPSEAIQRGGRCLAAGSFFVGGAWRRAGPNKIGNIEHDMILI